jgi:serine/threonine kinase PknH
MTIFISYARADQAAVEQLRGDVERCHRHVWIDRQLTGGQAWWRAIMQNIRDCDVFMVALSSQWVHSTACDLELRYAIALHRPLLPVMVTKVDPRLAPPAVADAQIIDYRQRSPEAMFALRDALDTLPAAPLLPAPLPHEPAAPISYRHNLVVMLNAPVLDPRNQQRLWQQLQAALDEAGDDDRDDLLELVRRLRKRRDLTPNLYSSIDTILGPAISPGQQTWPPINNPIETAENSVQPAPAPVSPPRHRSRPKLLWAALATAIVVCASSVGIAAAIANNAGRAENPPATTSTTSAPTTTATPNAPAENHGHNPAPAPSISSPEGSLDNSTYFTDVIIEPDPCEECVPTEPGDGSPPS